MKILIWLSQYLLYNDEKVLHTHEIKKGTVPYPDKIHNVDAFL